MPSLDLEEIVSPTPEEEKLAQASSSALARVPVKSGRVEFKFCVGGMEKREETVTIPAAAVKLLSTILTEMAQGRAVTIIPVHAELTTQEAANVLNVSRPFIIQLLENGKIPFNRVGTHRRVRYHDIMKYKKEVDSKRLAVLDELTRQAQELNMGYSE
jgi:excisionase family DNA binding protein